MYYTISTSDNITEIGYLPQVNLAKDFIPNSKDYTNVKWNSLFKENPSLNFDLNPKANVTDLITGAIPSFGLIISEKIKKILEQVNLPLSKFYPININKDNRKIMQYYWFHYLSDFWNYVDMKKSTYLILNKFTFKQLEEITIGTLDEVKEIKKSLPFDKIIRPKELYLTSQFPNYDIFEITDIQYITIISEKLKNTLLEKNITGCTFDEYSKIIF
jgi:hypothetical protein